MLLIAFCLIQNKDLNCQAQVQSPKVKTKGTWADTIITWATTTWPTAHHHMADCTLPPPTFKHEGVLW